MESTYIIVLSLNKFALLSVIRLEPYIYLLCNSKLFDNYDKINELLLKGVNIDFGNCINQLQIEISGEDYSKWRDDHEYIYKHTASAYDLEFLYKRKLLRDSSKRIQPIINELSTVSISPLLIDDTNIPMNRLINNLSSATKCKEICDLTGLLINTFPELDSDIAIRNIKSLVLSVFEQLDKNNLDKLEPFLHKWREEAVTSLPIELVNSVYRELKNTVLNLYAKRDAFLNGAGPESDVMEYTKTIATSITDNLDIMDLFKQGCFYSYIGLQLESSLLLVNQLFPSFEIPLVRINRNLDSYKHVNWIVNQCKHRIANTIYNNTANKLVQLETFFSYINSLSDKQLVVIDKQIGDKYKRTLSYIGSDEPEKELEFIFVKEYELYSEYKRVAYQLRRNQIESLLLSNKLLTIEDINYQFTVFYTFDYHEYSDDNVYMLMASIYSCIREFGTSAQILVYTTNTNQLTYLFLKYPELYKQVAIRNYAAERVHNFSDSNTHFNSIGHARIFIVKELLLETGRSVIYMDNDTGIQLASGEKCKKLMFSLEKPMGFAEEFHCTFADLIPGYVSDLRPINNGIILYPYNDFTLEFAEQNIKIYNELSVNSIYNDMLSFTITCQDKKCLNTIYNGVKTPCFIHYYINKHSLDIHDFNSTFYLIFFDGENYQELQL
jgi:hypothetical protein